jgi:hypothetical protein
MWYAIEIVLEILVAYMVFSFICGGAWIGLIELGRRRTRTEEAGAGPSMGHEEVGTPA